MKKIIIFLFLLNLFYCKSNIEKNEEYISFIYKPEESVQNVYLAGDFNLWKMNDEKYKMNRENNIYKLSIKKSLFQKGRNYYVFIVDGKWISDKNSKESVDRGFAGRVSVLEINH